MTVAELRFLEDVPRELKRLNENLEQLINLIKEQDNDTSKRVRNEDNIPV